MYRVLDSKTGKMVQRFPDFERASDFVVRELGQDPNDEYQRYTIVDETGAKCRPHEDGCTRDVSPECKTCGYHRDNMKGLMESWRRYLAGEEQVLKG